MPACAGAVAIVSMHARDDVVEGDALEVQLHLARGDARDVEQIVDEPREVVGLAFDDRERARELLAVAMPVACSSAASTIAPSGLRSSWPSIARNWSRCWIASRASYWRLRARSADVHRREQRAGVSGRSSSVTLPSPRVSSGPEVRDGELEHDQREVRPGRLGREPSGELGFDGIEGLAREHRAADAGVERSREVAAADRTRRDPVARDHRGGELGIAASRREHDDLQRLPAHASRFRRQRPAPTSARPESRRAVRRRCRPWPVIVSSRIVSSWRPERFLIAEIALRTRPPASK